MKKEQVDYQKFIEYADVKSVTLHFTKSTINLHFLAENNMKDKIFCGKTPMPLGRYEELDTRSWITEKLYGERRDLADYSVTRGTKLECRVRLREKNWNFEKYPNPYVFLTMA